MSAIFLVELAAAAAADATILLAGLLFEIDTLGHVRGTAAAAVAVSKAFVFE